MNRFVLAPLTAVLSGGALAAPVSYAIDPAHTYPSFEADHMGGLSIWRGKFTSTAGTIILDRDAKSGSIQVTVETASIDFGMPKLNDDAKSAQMFDVAKYPTATFAGSFSKFDGKSPTEATGTLTLHGVSKPLTLTIGQFLCKPHPMLKKEVCGADASATFNRSDFGISYGAAYGFNQTVRLQIQVEALRVE
jgi:polyisoprenoid-binding protein YceI